MGKRKKLRKRSEKLAYRVQILEQKQRINELLKQSESRSVGFHQRAIHKDEDQGKL